jgi:hypothetical protein
MILGVIWLLLVKGLYKALITVLLVFQFELLKLIKGKSGLRPKADLKSVQREAGIEHNTGAYR